MVLDFALENGLIRSCEADAEAARTADPPRRFGWSNPVDGTEMIWIPAGRFVTGVNKKKRLAVAEGFSLARHPTTNAQFRYFLEDTGYTPPAGHPNTEEFVS